MNDVFTWPVGRDGHRSRGYSGPAPLGPVLAYGVSTTVAGATVGLILGVAPAALVRLAGQPARDTLTVLVVVASVIAVLSELGGSASVLPQRRTQVPRKWLHWRSHSVTAVGFGLLIGSGILTPIRFASAYVLAGIVLLAPTPLLAAGIGGVYGACRGLALLITWIVDTLGRRRLPWDALAASGWLRITVALAATASLAFVLALGGV